MLGDDSTGNHLIISTGIPGTYGFYPDIRADSESENSYQQTIDRFKNKFEDFTLNINSSGSERDQIIFKKIGNYTSGKTVGTVFKSGNNAAIAVHNIRYDEINTVLQSSSSKAEALFYLDNPYWITPVDESYNGLLHIVDYDGGKTFQDYSQTNLGIRPVVVLSASTKLVRNQNGIWEIK